MERTRMELLMQKTAGGHRQLHMCSKYLLLSEECDFSDLCYHGPCGIFVSFLCSVLVRVEVNKKTR